MGRSRTTSASGGLPCIVPQVAAEIIAAMKRVDIGANAASDRMAGGEAGRSE